jgi:RNA polymerase sigma-70 factor, ECF subfamily
MHAAIPDEKIVSLISGHRREAVDVVEALYDLYADRLYRYLLARTGDPEAAADLTTELFLRVLKSIGGFRFNPERPVASVSAWLYRIAANLAADYHRAGHGAILTELEAEVDEIALEPEPQHLAERRETLVELARALECLSEEQRLVVIGKFGEDMSNVQLARWLGKTEGAIKSLQHRALRTLARLLGTEEA